MKRFILVTVFLATCPAFAIAADTATKTPAKPARSAVDPAKEAEHMKEDIKRHRIIAAAHGGSDFFLGERPYVCDIYLANLSKWWKMRDYLRNKHPAFCDSMERDDALPEVAPVWQRHWS